MSHDDVPADLPNESPLSLSRLREAFAQMLGEQPNDNAQDEAPSPQLCEISPRSVVEAILFVGRPDNGTFTARELAAAMRGVSPQEVATAVSQLNATYDADGAPYQIEGTAAGYRMVLRPEFEPMRDRFYRRTREARLSPAALEVLSVVAYNQPVTTREINALRGAPSGAVLATLTRRRLVRQQRPPEAEAQPTYSTTERFLKIFGLDRLESLPRTEELDKL